MERGDVTVDDGTAFAADDAYEDADPEELLEQAQSNAQALIVATVAFLDERGIPLDDWTAAIGSTFAKAWDDPGEWDAGEFLDAMLVNFRSLGAEVTSSTLGPDRAEATVAGFPDPDLCAVFGVDASRVARYNDATAVIATQQGITWSWQIEGDATRFVATKGS
jgi:hypothetical protein